MEFFKGLMSVVFVYAIGWSIYQWGYMNGAETEETLQVANNLKLQNCQKIVVGGGW